MQVGFSHVVKRRRGLAIAFLFLPSVAVAQDEVWGEGAAEMIAVRDAYRTARTEEIANVTAWCRAIIKGASRQERLAVLAKVEEGGALNDRRQVIGATQRHDFLLELDQDRANATCKIMPEDELIRKLPR